MPSIISNEDVLSLIRKKYEFKIMQCEFYKREFHDNYIIETEVGDYFLRLYKPYIRNLGEVLFEVDFLSHLHSKGISVSYPIANKDGSFITEMNCFQEKRFMVLFSFAPGKYPDPEEDICYKYGQFIANFQKEAANYKSKHERSYRFDLEFIVDRPMELIKPALNHRINDLEYLTDLSNVMKERINQLSLSKLEWGCCHGDLHFMNLHIYNEDFYLFDFDCCAYGFLAYDLGTIRWDFAFTDDLWSKFIDGYTSVRELPKAELNAIPLFATLRNIWNIGHNLKYSETYNVDDEYWDTTLKFIRKWVTKNKYL